ncbi:hypothetical protein ACFSUK_01170 [Sphingobium scionense]
MIHADDAALSLMFDVAGGALRRFRVELRRLLRPEIRARMAGETGPGFDALARRVAGRALAGEGLVGARERAGRYELRHQAGIPRRVRSHPDRDRGDHHQQGRDEDGVGKTLPAHSQRSP